MPATAKRAGKTAVKGKGKKKNTAILKYYIDCAKPCEQNIFAPDSFTTFLTAKIKVGGKTGKLGDAVKISTDGSKISVVAHAPFSKRYLKYLTKKFLKKNQLRDFLRVVASSKNTYTVKYFDIHEEEDVDAEGN